MDFDFIRYKARVLRTASYNVILFEARIDIASIMAIQVVNINSKPVVVMLVSRFDVDAIIRVLESKHIAANMAGASVMGVVPIVLDALHIITNLEESCVVNVAGLPCGAIPIMADSLDAVVSLVTAMVTPTTVNANISFIGASSSTATLWTGNYSAFNVSAASKLLIAMALNCGSPLDLKTITYNYFEIAPKVTTCVLDAIKAISLNSMDLLARVHLGDKPLLISVVANRSLIIITDMSSKDSKAIKAEKKVKFNVTASMALLHQSTLSSYDNRTIASLDKSSLQALAYTE